MEVSSDTLETRLEELARKLADVQCRLERLEHTAAPASEAPETPVDRSTHPALHQPGGEAALQNAESFVPLLGWSLLGIAGAYLLRSLNEAALLPGLVGVAAGIAYAAAWLFVAARRAAEKRLQSTIHALTSSLILAPMLWETTVRFQLLSPLAASVILVLFTLFGLAIGWRNNLVPLAWIVALSALGVSTLLFRVTHDAVLWSGTVLAIAVAAEFSACRDHWLSLRWLVAFVADLSVLLLTMAAVAPSDEGSILIRPATAWVLAMQVGLLTVYLCSTLDRTLIRSLKITGFEIGQACIAFLISLGGILRLAGAGGAGSTGAGIFCLAAGLGCYVISFANLDRRESANRNFYTYSTFALILMLAGGRLLFSGSSLVLLAALLSVCAVTAGFLRDRRTLRLHGLFFLLFAVVESGLISWAALRILGRAPDGPAAPALSLAAAALAAFVCYLSAIRFGRSAAAHWTRRISAFLPAMVSCFALAGWLSGPVAGAGAAGVPLRTTLLVLLAVGSALIGKRIGHVELTWLAYPLMALSGFKILSEDLRTGQSLLLFASLIVFGGGLVLLPRILKRPSLAAPVPSLQE
jgi:hypothetical protein